MFNQQTIPVMSSCDSRNISNLTAHGSSFDITMIFECHFLTDSYQLSSPGDGFFHLWNLEDNFQPQEKGGR